jgi:putative transposase
MKIERPNQAWAADITYIPMEKGFLYLVAIIDLYSRYVLAWRLSNSLETGFCVEALKEALQKGTPEIFNTDQGSQFTSDEFVSILVNNGIKVSMDSKGRYLDNIFVERFWRTLKYEEVYLKAYRDAREARSEIGKYIRFYNSRRPHQSLDIKHLQRSIRKKLLILLMYICYNHGNRIKELHVRIDSRIHLNFE